MGEYGDQDPPEWGTDDATGPWGGRDGSDVGDEPPRYVVDNVPVTVLAERVQYTWTVRVSSSPRASRITRASG